MAEEPTLYGEEVTDLSEATFPDTPELHGKIVTLKLTQESDYPALWESVGKHKEIFTFWPAGPYEEPAEFEKDMRGLLGEKTVITYTIFIKGKAEGNIMLQPTDLPNRVMEIGMIYGPAMQRSRAGTEAFYLLSCLSMDKDKHNNRRLEWKTNLLNKPSQRTAARFGLTYEGCNRQKGIQQGRNRDVVWYGMIDKEWPVCKRAMELWLDDANFDEHGKQKQSLAEVRKGINDKQT